MLVSGTNDSGLLWTAPICLAEGSAPVSVTATNDLGLSATMGFGFSVTQNLSLNHQTSFLPADFETLQNVTLTPNSKIQTTPPAPPLSVERIVFTHDQPLSISLVGGTTTGSNTLGWLYYDDLVARGYIDTQGTPADSSDDTLRDANGNGIADLHEDLYNLAPPTGTAPLGQEAAFLPVSGTGTMPHALLSAPSTTPDRWFLGFEDLSGGEDRDFNDAVFMLRAPAQPGWVRSRTLTSPDPRCALSRVRPPRPSPSTPRWPPTAAPTPRPPGGS
ncbi:DUF4114 domain-containing protein [Melittangium boletus]|uniref:Uncharacterized protein n=1 Tax=Melittangium boletus DSM 14713 TaxID=1294270 RepID=A0A250IMD7_9BACT|nr:DUF4114 domain-containing protein [Melittangium boletus]ATB32337.1 hypothetical protein MEBOL_005814 [Melittangium boletus DSM 14713]